MCVRLSPREHTIAGKEATADVVPFLNDKRVNDLNNVLARYLVDNTEDCLITDEISNDNFGLCKKVIKLIEQENFPPVGTE